MKPESECQRLKIKNPDYTHFFPEHTLNKEAVFVLQVTIIDKLLLRLIDLSTPEIYHTLTLMSTFTIAMLLILTQNFWSLSQSHNIEKSIYNISFHDMRRRRNKLSTWNS